VSLCLQAGAGKFAGRMQTCHVRPAVALDASVSVAVLRSSIATLCVADHANEPATLERWLRNKTEAAFVQWLADSCNFVVVAEQDAAVRGVGLIDTSRNVRLCYVEPGFQRRGIGRALLQSLESHAVRSGFADVRLGSSVGAREFYERHGYLSSGPPERVFGVLMAYPYVKDLRELVEHARGYQSL
jgi:GNAT superfamily N-acetyltransferase